MITGMWVAGVYAGLDPSIHTKDLPNIARVTRLRDEWITDVNRLMTWLDWSVRVKCDPACGPEVGLCSLFRLVD